MAKHPLGEVFGFPINSDDPDARRHRELKLCRFNNKVPNCTKDRIASPLGVCSLSHRDRLSIICPVRFRENWSIIEDAAKYFFAPGTRWTALTEVRLDDAHGSARFSILARLKFRRFTSPEISEGLLNILWKIQANEAIWTDQAN